MKKETQASMKELISSFDKKFGKNKVLLLDSENVEGFEHISSGSYALNDALGSGYAKGRIIEIYGPEASGKTTLTLHAIAEAQKLGITCGFIDMEHAFNKSYAEMIGVDCSKLFFTQPDYGEEALMIAEELVKNGVGLVVVDSVATMIPKAELEGEYGESKMGLHARMMSQAMRKINTLVSKNKSTLIFINQTRNKIGVMFGDPTTTTGGEALKFYASQRIEVASSSKIKDPEGNIIGNSVRTKIIKNKMASPFKVAKFNLFYGFGIDTLGEIIEMLIEKAIIKKSGSWYSYGDHKLGQGENQLRTLLEDNPELFEELKNKLFDGQPKND